MSIFKNFMMKQMLKRQLKSLPEAQQEVILKAVEANPDFFLNIAEKIKEKVNGGMGQTEASMKVMREHEAELRKIMGTEIRPK